MEDIHKRIENLIDDCNYLVTAISGGYPRPRRREESADKPDTDNNLAD